MRIIWSLMAALGVAATGPGIANAEQTFEEARPIIAKEVFKGTQIAFEPGGKYFNSMLIITGPRNYQAEVFVRDSLPQISLSKFGKLTDGIYSYHMTAATPEFIEIINPGLNNGRGDIPGANRAGKGYRQTANAKRMSISAELSGIFCVKDGVIVPMEDIKEE